MPLAGLPQSTPQGVPFIYLLFIIITVLQLECTGARTLRHVADVLESLAGSVDAHVRSRLHALPPFAHVLARLVKKHRRDAECVARLASLIAELAESSADLRRAFSDLGVRRDLQQARLSRAVLGRVERAL